MITPIKTIAGNMTISVRDENTVMVMLHPILTARDGNLYQVSGMIRTDGPVDFKIDLTMKRMIVSDVETPCQYGDTYYEPLCVCRNGQWVSPAAPQTEIDDLSALMLDAFKVWYKTPGNIALLRQELNDMTLMGIAEAYNFLDSMTEKISAARMRLAIIEARAKAGQSTQSESRSWVWLLPSSDLRNLTV